MSTNKSIVINYENILNKTLEDINSLTSNEFTKKSSLDQVKMIDVLTLNSSKMNYLIDSMIENLVCFKDNGISIKNYLDTQISVYIGIISEIQNSITIAVKYLISKDNSSFTDEDKFNIFIVQSNFKSLDYKFKLFIEGYKMYVDVHSIKNLDEKDFRIITKEELIEELFSVN